MKLRHPRRRCELRQLSRPWISPPVEISPKALVYAVTQIIRSEMDSSSFAPTTASLDAARCIRDALAIARRAMHPSKIAAHMLV